VVDASLEKQQNLYYYKEQGVTTSSSTRALICFLAWCAFAEKSGILEPIFVNETLNYTKKKNTKKNKDESNKKSNDEEEKITRWKDRARFAASGREEDGRVKFFLSKRMPRVSFQRGKTYFTEKRFKKSISDGTETKFDAKGEKLKAEMQKRKNVEILRKELRRKKLEEARQIELEREKTQKDAEMKAQKVKEELELKAKKRIDLERKKQEQKEKEKAKQAQRLQQKAMRELEKKMEKTTTKSAAASAKKTTIIQMPKVSLPADATTRARESISKSASSFAEFSKSVSASAFETSKSIGSSVADVSVKVKDATVSAVGKTASTAADVATKTKNSLLSIELPKRKTEKIETRAKKREEKKKKESNVEKLKPEQKKKNKTTKTKASTAGTSSASSSSSLAKARTLIGDKVTSAVQFATTNIRPPSSITAPTNLSPAAIQQSALYVSSFLLLAFTSSRVRKNRRERAQKRAEREIRLAADRERQKQRWTKAIAQNPDSSQLLGNRTSKTAKTITKDATSKRVSAASQDDEFDEVRKMNRENKANNESGWDEKEYEKMNKEYQKFLKDSRLPKGRK
jgi:hypothetical protein